MGRQAGASHEELAFIFECFLRGLSDREVLEEMQNEAFPLRNVRFIRDRRRHFEAARTVLTEHIQTEQDQVIIEARQRHFDDLLTVADEWIGQLYIPPDHELHRTESPKSEFEDNRYLLSTSWRSSATGFQYLELCWTLQSDGLLYLHCNVEQRKPELFESLCQHIPSLRDDYFKWQRLSADCIEAFKDLYQKIMDEAEQRTGLRFGLESAPRLCAFADNIYLELTYPIELFDEPEPVYRIDPSSTGYHRLMLGRVLLAEGPERIMGKCRRIHKTMMRDYLASQNNTRCVGLSRQQYEVARKLHQQLKEISLRRVFPGKCKLCPD